MYTAEKDVITSKNVVYIAVFFNALIGTSDAPTSEVRKAAWFAKLMAGDLRHPFLPHPVPSGVILMQEIRSLALD